MEKRQKVELKKENNSGWWILLLLLLLLWAWSNNDSYKSCVEDCAMDNEMCLMDSSDYSPNGFEYIDYYDAESCAYDLTSCIEFDCG